eukprot:5302246-Prorocentrum_lima.AAC.1
MWDIGHLGSAEAADAPPTGVLGANHSQSEVHCQGGRPLPPARRGSFDALAPLPASAVPSSPALLR